MRPGPSHYRADMDRAQAHRAQEAHIGPGPGPMEGPFPGQLPGSRPLANMSLTGSMGSSLTHFCSLT